MEHRPSPAPGAPTPAVVRELVRDQAPHLSAEAVSPAPGSGSSNWVFRLGQDHAVRLPRDDSYVDDLLTETQWLPRLGPLLTVPVPEIVLVGEPSSAFPRPWSVVTWLPGEVPAQQSPAEQGRLATSLGRFTRNLHAADTLGQPAGADHWGYRSGDPVTDRIDAWADEAAEGLADLFDPRQVREAWQRVRRVPPASGPPCWIHSDLSAENLLVGSGGELVGVIDFGALGIGDRSADLLYAWSLFDEEARDAFRVASEADEATWLRARAWAFVGPGIRTIEGYRDSMAERTRRLIRMVEAIAAEVGVALR
ncbi:MAG TPA: aminoglycoside phosphotransferase family protein [Candidatus Janibacter merdipullorum]|nr:aminoglycoside phosphotransferase family protein [Candidatus Janibacter merdipullorum]